MIWENGFQANSRKINPKRRHKRTKGTKERDHINRAKASLQADGASKFRARTYGDHSLSLGMFGPWMGGRDCQSKEQVVIWTHFWLYGKETEEASNEYMYWLFFVLSPLKKMRKCR